MRVVERINPIVRGWVYYFAIGHSGRCLSYIRDWVEHRACPRPYPGIESVKLYDSHGG